MAQFDTLHQFVKTCIPLIASITASLTFAAEPPDTNYDESKVPRYELPEIIEPALLRAKAATFWEKKRRNEVLRLLEDNVYGRTPRVELGAFGIQVRESSSEALDGKAIRKQVSIILDPARDLAIDLLIYLPKNSPQAGPCFLGLNFYGNQTIHPDPNITINPRWMRGNSTIGIKNNRATEATRGVYRERWQVETLINRGYALATAYCGDIDPDNYRHDFGDGVHPLFYEPGQTKPLPNEWGTIGAWAWGLSRALDYLEENEPRVNSDKVCLIGHSRLGKTSLWAGAQDERFALVISNNSGCGGAALYRREFGERIHHMIKPVGYWFCGNHAQFAKREQALPVDQHMLLALIAPRPLYVASASKDLWADPKGEFLAAKAATEVYEILGKPGLPVSHMPAPNTSVQGTIGYHIREGEHAVTAFDWKHYLDFADRHLAP